MERCRFIDGEGTFTLENAGAYRGLYFPLAGETGLKSAVTAYLAGDAKTDQNHFLLPPVSIGDLFTGRFSRAFWCVPENGAPWSANGCSAAQHTLLGTADEEPCGITAGYMWLRTTRTGKQFRAEILSFVLPEGDAEIHQLRVENVSDAPVTFTPVAAVPLYGRSADDLRDHRHVTSLLHRICVQPYGVTVTPALSFDERGHQPGDSVYAVLGMDEEGRPPERFFPEQDAFTGPGGTLEWPEALLKNDVGVEPGFVSEGQEALGGLRFAKTTLAPGESREYTLALSVTPKGAPLPTPRERFTDKNGVYAAWERVRAHWRDKVNIRFSTGEPDFDGFMRWVAFQPELRRIFGCSFLPHHDYGKGGRGWRDLWQDCLALLLMDPDQVRRMLLDNFAGVRIDGTNATIIGEGPGQFKADRNAITRVWMDHGVWPMMTTALYIDQTGDLAILDEEQRYFKDRQVRRGAAVDGAWQPERTWQQDASGREYTGTVLEHLLAQDLTAFWDVGEHNHPRLRDADWNDALDMAAERGESVAFASAYAGDLLDLARLIEVRARRGRKTVSLLREMTVLLEGGEALYEDVPAKRALLDRYLDGCVHTVSGERVELDADAVAAALREKGLWLMEHIRRTEWLTDSRGHGWFNGYYDNHGQRLEGERGGGVRMTLTGQVFPVMCGTATDEQVRAVCASADEYLYDGACGGYRLNTRFDSDMGRMFGFAYGEKENGAVFSHMAVMYANALYRRGFVREGRRALDSLFRQAMDFPHSRICPGLPEYFGRDGRGLYHYLTGAASWYLLTMVTEVFGVRGRLGELVIEPRLLPEQFDKAGLARLELPFAGRLLRVDVHAPAGGAAAPYRVASAALDGAPLDGVRPDGVTVPRDTLTALDGGRVHQLDVYLQAETDALRGRLDETMRDGDAAPPEISFKRL